MNQELKRKWVEALLSGEYKQGKNYLYDNGRYCCLGVLVKVKTGTRPGRGWGVQPKYVTDEMVCELADLNDEGVPFDMIAGLIDQAL